MHVIMIYVIISEFDMAWRRNFTKIFISRRGDVCLPCPDGVEIAYVQSG